MPKPKKKNTTHPTFRPRAFLPPLRLPLGTPVALSDSEILERVNRVNDLLGQSRPLSPDVLGDVGDACSAALRNTGLIYEGVIPDRLSAPDEFRTFLEDQAQIAWLEERMPGIRVLEVLLDGRFLYVCDPAGPVYLSTIDVVLARYMKEIGKGEAPAVDATALRRLYDRAHRAEENLAALRKVINDNPTAQVRQIEAMHLYQAAEPCDQGPVETPA